MAPCSGRIALGVEYDGTDFQGWQVQSGVRTVQAVLEEAIARVADHPVQVQAAGRTDAGVHAIEQVVHFDTRACRSERAWVLGVNTHLPPDVAVRWAHPVTDDFHARFSATGRHYRYQILMRRTRSPLERHRAVWVHEPLDLERMQRAAQALIGEHDFSSFRALSCQAKSPIRRVFYLELEQQDEHIALAIGANGFLHHMVRNIAGVLIAIGRGEAPVDWTAELLRLKDRRLGGVTAPPQGLYFVRADYPERCGLPQIGRRAPLARLRDERPLLSLAEPDELCPGVA
ncbi:tRNA pseudouridine(38-40) synthase TruA [Caldichromatium japonicum]|uniref:tRNA pseudouridine synthase A n=1 Tax=Caldichromatium japonicum TaxID=2699430 RepID=A0A6G7VA48_9GAMM|nr:tRNA pseudouridine(38-40) synthase TruA [Caldichromatium japonicum]QIK36832.1 tRNA pseudouridine(38-40) synthase TruA [Caldichromatium japonicum]